MKVLVLILSLIFISPCIAQTNLTDTVGGENSSFRSAEAGFAEEEFRRGVQSYYRGAFNESILEFERTLSYLPGEPLVLEWLGKAYYKAGIESSAIQQWNYAVEAGQGGILLQNKIEIVSDRQLEEYRSDVVERFTEVGSFPSSAGDSRSAEIYSRPFSSLANPDGSFFVTAYGSNEILRFDVNGNVTLRVRGPINGFDCPTDIIRLLNGDLAVCESAGDRIAILDSNGRFIKYYGARGRGQGQFVGPQYLAEDSFGNIYVTDFGNARVVVFDSDGNGLLCFGDAEGAFEGFKSPTGIAIADDRVFVADSVRGGIYEFDRTGKYIDILVPDGSFARPEALKYWQDGCLLLADRGRIYCVDTTSGAYTQTGVIGHDSMLTSAVPDENGNIIVTDFQGNEIYIMSKMSELVGGFFVQFERVVADNFPEVVVEVKVENRNRQPIVGLRSENFYLTEGRASVQDFELIGAANNNDVADITLLVNRSSAMREFEEQVTTAVREIAGAMNGRGNLTLISASEVPEIEASGNPAQFAGFSASALTNPYSDTVALDLGIRLATNSLINAEKKSSVIYISAGEASGQHVFSQYGLYDLVSYLNNNSIAFASVWLSQSATSEEVDYITNNTAGGSYYIYRPEGLGGIISDIIAIPSGVYQFSFTSSMTTDYGRRYLPLEIEVYLLNRSGRDETGYFAPLE